MTGRQEGDYCVLGQDAAIIGRSTSLPFHLLDLTVSREHIKIYFDNDKQQYFASDMGSRHGVFINESNVKDNMALAEGDRITIGQTDMLFTEEDIVDKEGALARLKNTKLEFPTIEISTSLTQKYLADTVHRNELLLQGFRQWAGSKKMTLAIVFTDIIESTLLTHNLGNECMDQMRRTHFARTRSLIKEHNGYEIKTNGDEFMVAFRTAVNALEFALDLHSDTGDERVKIRAGVHIGPVIIEEEDVQGAAVIYAARVIGMAVDGSVWISNEVKNHVDQEKAHRHKILCWQNHPDCELKGFPGKHLLWSVEKNS
jgi:class 3 adenylate cyclase